MENYNITPEEQEAKDFKMVFHTVGICAVIITVALCLLHCQH